MGKPQQLPLFEGQSGQTSGSAGDNEKQQARPDTSLAEAMRIYEEAMRLDGNSEYTIKAFRSDLHVLGRYTGFGKPIGTFATQDLNDFLHWMLHERAVPCSPKSYARRVTTLKHFFSYLVDQGAIPKNPADAIIQRSVSSPLPEILSEAEIKRVLDVTQTLRTNADRPDARPHLLVTLLLQTAIKKGECMALHPSHIDDQNPDEPYLWVRYTNPRLRYKERKIGLEAEWPHVLNEYLSQYRPPDVIFNCTARNLEYVLDDVATRAGAPRKKLSFETLRWTCAVRDYRAGMEPEPLRQKLGLSRISWRETGPKIEQLAEMD